MKEKIYPKPLHRYIIVEELQKKSDPEEEEDTGFDFSGFEDPEDYHFNHHETVKILSVGPKVEHPLKKGDIVVIGDTHLTRKIILPDNREVMVVTENQLVLTLD